MSLYAGKNAPINTTSNESYVTVSDIIEVENKGVFPKNRHVYTVQFDADGNRSIVGHVIADGVSKVAALPDLMSGAAGTPMTNSQIQAALIAAITPAAYTAQFPNDPPTTVALAFQAMSIAVGAYDASTKPASELYTDLNTLIKNS